MLAVATFSRPAGHPFGAGGGAISAPLRSVLTPSRENDPAELVRFGDQQILRLRGHGGAIAVGRDAVYLALSVRNGGAGLAVIHGWRVKPRPGYDTIRDEARVGSTAAAGRVSPPADRPFVSAGDSGYWLGALRDPAEPIYDIVRRAATAANVQVDLFTGITRPVSAPSSASSWRPGLRRPSQRGRVEQDGKRVIALRYWNVDRDDPR